MKYALQHTVLVCNVVDIFVKDLISLINSYSLDAGALAQIVWSAYTYVFRAALKTLALLRVHFFHAALLVWKCFLTACIGFVIPSFLILDPYLRSHRMICCSWLLL